MSGSDTGASSTVTADNASGQNDGAALCVVTTAAVDAVRLRLTPILALRSWAVTGSGPEVMGQQRPDRTQRGLRCAQVLAIVRMEGRPLDDGLNPNGSGIALGHPIAPAAPEYWPPRLTRRNPYTLLSIDAASSAPLLEEGTRNRVDFPYRPR